MPIYEYRCQSCGEVSTTLAPISAIPTQIPCELCGIPCHRILSRPSVHLSARSKTARLDPKYDKRVDQAIRNTPMADPDRLINRRGDSTKGRPDD